MATYSRRSFLPSILLLLVLSSSTLQGAVGAGRGVPTADSSADKKLQKQKGAVAGDGGVPAAASVDKKLQKQKGAAASTDKKQTECLGQEGTALIPGIGRYAIGSTEMPNISGLDSSGPAAANQQYLPGGDDTFVPNPGYEIPNPFHAGGATTP